MTIPSHRTAVHGWSLRTRTGAVTFDHGRFTLHAWAASIARHLTAGACTGPLLGRGVAAKGADEGLTAAVLRLEHVQAPRPGRGRKRGEGTAPSALPDDLYENHRSPGADDRHEIVHNLGVGPKGGRRRRDSTSHPLVRRHVVVVSAALCERANHLHVRKFLREPAQ